MDGGRLLRLRRARPRRLRGRACSSSTPAAPSTPIPGANVEDVGSGTLGAVAKSSKAIPGYSDVTNTSKFAFSNGQETSYEVEEEMVQGTDRLKSSQKVTSQYDHCD